MFQVCQRQRIKTQSVIGDDQNKIKRPLLQGLANTSVHCISVSVLRGFALVAFGDLKISINYNCLLYIPYADAGMELL